MFGSLHVSVVTHREPLLLDIMLAFYHFFEFAAAAQK